MKIERDQERVDLATLTSSHLNELLNSESIVKSKVANYLSEKNELLNDIKRIQISMDKYEDDIRRAEELKNKDIEIRMKEVDELSESWVENYKADECKLEDLKKDIIEIDNEIMSNNLFIEKSIEEKKNIIEKLTELESEYEKENNSLLKLIKEKELKDDELKKLEDEINKEKSIEELKANEIEEQIKLKDEEKEKLETSLAEVQEKIKQATSEESELLNKISEFSEKLESNSAKLKALENEVDTSRINLNSIIEDSKNLMVQENSYKTYNFGEKVEHLSFEAELIRSNLREMRDLTNEIMTKVSLIG